MNKKLPINICLAGGLFANVKLTKKSQKYQSKKYFCFSNMGDGGLTIGSACHQNYIINGNTKVDFSTVYLGGIY